MTVSAYKKKIWKQYVSPYIRLRDTRGRYGGRYGKCITCGERLTYKKGHAGHWRHGSTKRTYFFEKNIHIQCPSCNFYKDGARDVYAVKLEEKYGFGILQDIHAMDDPKWVWTIEKLKVVEEEYKQKLANLKDELCKIKSHPTPF